MQCHAKRRNPDGSAVYAVLFAGDGGEFRGRVAVPLTEHAEHHNGGGCGAGGVPARRDLVERVRTHSRNLPRRLGSSSEDPGISHLVQH